MPASKSPNSLSGYADVFQRALDSPKGVKITLPSRAEAVNFRAGLNRYRAQDRAANAKIYPADHPMHAISVYDPYKIVLRETTLVIEPVVPVDLQIEDV